MILNYLEKSKRHVSWVNGLGGLFVILASPLISATLSSCSSAPSKPLSASSRIPGGRGTLTLAPNSSKNSSLAIEVNHLAQPDKITAGANTYVVWLEPTGEGSRPQNVGAFSVDNNLNGEFKTVTPFNTFDLFVTAEPSSTMIQPSGERVFWAQVDQGKVG